MPITMLTRYTGVVDLHINGVSATAHQVRVADVNRAVISAAALDAGWQIGQLDAVSSRRAIFTGRVRRRNAVERLDDSDQLWAAVRPSRTPQSKCRHTWNAETLAADVDDR